MCSVCVWVLHAVRCELSVACLLGCYLSYVACVSLSVRCCLLFIKRCSLLVVRRLSFDVC